MTEGATMTDRVLAEFMGYKATRWQVSVDFSFQDVFGWLTPEGHQIEEDDWHPSSNETQLAQCFEKAIEDQQVNAVIHWLKANKFDPNEDCLISAIIDWQLAKTSEKADALAEVVRGGE